jgi:hypothetical protein
MYAVNDRLRLAVLMSAQQILVNPQPYRMIVVGIFDVPFRARPVLLNGALKRLFAGHLNLSCGIWPDSNADVKQSWMSKSAIFHEQVAFVTAAAFLETHSLRADDCHIGT